MNGVKVVVGGTVGVVLAIVLLFVVILLPSSEEECGPGQTRTPAGGTASCAATGLPAEDGLKPKALQVLRCVVAHFGIRNMGGVRADAFPDHPSGNAVDIMLDGSEGGPLWSTVAGKTKGDDIVSFLQQNSAAFGIEYLIWQQRSWTPDPSGQGRGNWQPMEDRGSPTQNHLDHIHVTTKSDGADSDSVTLAGAADPGRPPVDEAGGLQKSNVRMRPIPEGQYTISDGFGTRGGAHKGVDYAAPTGTPIYAATDGRVVAAGPASGFGHWIVIDSIDENGGPFSTVYGHMYADGVGVRTGDTVRAGQQIGAVGSDGESSGPHLHFELVPGGRFTGGKQVDPEPWLGGAPSPSGGATLSTDPRCANGFGSAGGNLAGGKLPPELEIWYRRAGSLCPQISSSLLAAQGQAETGFRRGLTSPAGAQGLGQFLPSTAAATDPLDGQPYVIDADGNGVASVWDDGDAIIGQGRYMCSIAAQIDQWKADGRVQGDTAALSLAAYNAGEGAVLASGGMPNQVPGHFSETQPYVSKILAAEPNFRGSGSTGRFQPDDSAPIGGQVVQAGMQYLGTPYVYGGGGPEGPSNGGLDCSGLTSAAVYAASGGTVTLPRTSEGQWRVGTEVPISEAQPGDLVFAEFGPNGPGHVGIYVGDGQMLHAPDTGDHVRVAPLMSGMRARHVT